MSLESESERTRVMKKQGMYSVLWSAYPVFVF